MRLVRLVKWAGLLLAVPVVGAAAVLSAIDLNDYRGEIAAEFRALTGRDLAIGGDIGLALSFRPAVVVEDLAVANPGWGSRPAMARFGRAEARLELLPLAVGELRIDRLVLVEPDILLETDAGGVPNWRFAPETEGGRAETGAGPASPAKAGPDGGPAIPLFSRIEIRRGRLTFRDGQDGAETRIDLHHATLAAQSPDAPLRIHAEGAWNRSPFLLSGTVDSLARLTSGAPVGLDIEGEAFGMAVRLAGSAAQPHRLAGLDLGVSIRGADLSTLAPLAGPGLPRLGPLDLAAGVRGGAARVEIDRIELSLGSSDLSGRLAVARRGPRPRVAGSLVSRRIDLAELLPPGAPEAPPGGAAPASAGAKPGRVFPDDPLPLAGLEAVDLDLELRVAELAVPSAPTASIAGRVALDGGALRLKPLSVTVAGSRVEASLRLDSRQAPPRFALALDAADLDLGRLLKETGATGLFEGRATLRAALAGTGRSVAALMAGLDGEIRLLSGAGLLRTRALDHAVGGAGAVLGTLVSGRKRWTVVNCAIGSLAVAGGRATSRATLIDTEYSTVAARGHVDLARERLRLTVEPRAKSATLNVAVPVHVRGTLARPEIRPDAGATLKKLGGLVGIALFPPAAIAGLGELGDGGGDCLKIASAPRGKRARSNPRPALPASPRRALGEIGKGAESAVKELGRGLGKILGGGRD